MNHLLLTMLQAQSQEGGWMTLVMFGAMFAVFYFFMIRPQAKKQKEQKKFRESLEVGAKVVTIGGVHGKILEINDIDVLISVEQGKMRVEKAAISKDSSMMLMVGK